MDLPTRNTRTRESRRHFRIRYPLRLRPRLEVEGVSAAVIDVSEGGIRIVYQKGMPLLPGDAVACEVKFCCGDGATLSGNVIRVTEQDVAFSLARGISFSIIVREQRALRTRQRYPV